MGRREVLKRAGAAGAVLWAAPVVQVLTVRAADAASGPVQQPPTLPPEGPYASHGFVVVKAGSGLPFAVKIDSGTPGQLTSVNHSEAQDAAQMNEKFGAGNWRYPTAAELASFTSFGTGTYGGVTPAQEGMFIDVPSGYSFVKAYTYDGSFASPSQSCGDGDKYTRAFVAGNRIWFLKRCNEPASGE